MAASSASSADLAELDGLSVDVLRSRWTELFGVEPARRVSRELLSRGVAYRLQEKAAGGLAKKTLRQLDRMAKEFGSSGTVKVDPAGVIRPGTRIVREWQGRVHEVIVLDDGYLWKGARYRSLSEIARSITGTRWSGPRFFGILAKKRTGRANHDVAASVLTGPAAATGSADPADVAARAAGFLR